MLFGFCIFFGRGFCVERRDGLALLVTKAWKTEETAEWLQKLQTCLFLPVSVLDSAALFLDYFPTHLYSKD